MLPGAALFTCPNQPGGQAAKEVRNGADDLADRQHQLRDDFTFLQRMVFPDRYHDCADPMLSLQMVASVKDTSVSFALSVSCGDMTGYRLIMS
ncbi:MAG: hypothetical protein OXG60_13865 [Chloroflexi bacterium]|nr:hypothetical protein [Chloroflexota bacterium]